MEKKQHEDAGLFVPFAGSLSPILFSEEEDSEYDSLNSADRRENTIVLHQIDRSPEHRVSSEDALSSSSTGDIYKLGSRTNSPSHSESEEEPELTYNSPTTLLEISSSSSSTRIPEENNFGDNNEKQSLGLEYWAKPSSDYSSESECSNSDPQSIPDFICHENSPSLRIQPHDQVPSRNEQMGSRVSHPTRYLVEKRRQQCFAQVQVQHCDLVRFREWTKLF
ncbi:uncharacterized protein LOC143817526 [Ranitomeya variabilis]|uniref:uncharacterized protein LOC143817526 n=1 Tax=Ranitomeya variabilis TaxID=490064 RepID=UPI004056CA36